MRATARFLSGALIAAGVAILSLCVSAEAQVFMGGEAAMAAKDNYVELTCKVKCGFGNTDDPCYTLNENCVKNKLKCDGVDTCK